MIRNFKKFMADIVLATPACSCGLPKLDVAVASRGCPGVDAVVDQLPEAPVEPPEEAREDDPHHVDVRKIALHSHSGSICRCPLCLSAKQRRNAAEVGSHPHGEEKCARTPGLHSFSDLPTYLDFVDYGAS